MLATWSNRPGSALHLWAAESRRAVPFLTFPVQRWQTRVDIASGTLICRRSTGNVAADVGAPDENIARQGGPLIAWFTDPAGNIMSVLEE